jgi:hypothetical protein
MFIVMRLCFLLVVFLVFGPSLGRYPFLVPQGGQRSLYGYDEYSDPVPTTPPLIVLGSDMEQGMEGQHLEFTHSLSERCYLPNA